MEKKTPSGNRLTMHWGISKTHTLLLGVFLLVFFLLVWRIFSVSPVVTIPTHAREDSLEEDAIPNLVVENLHVAYSKGGTKEKTLRFKRARQVTGPDGPLYSVEEPVVEMAKVDEMTFTLEADTGSYDPGTGDWTLCGSVHAASGSVREFFADRAQYFAARDRIVAWGEDRPLRLIDHGLEIEGKELRTDGDFEMIEITEAEGKLEGDFLPTEEEQVDE
jgi:hypothetical protein